ncbi:MAG: methyl-accepting chemotaxis protein [Planctomycetes bacterium]|nr:methyl-accepting chemotaxis protein [Planctomycetota bacterium]
MINKIRKSLTLKLIIPISLILVTFFTVLAVYQTMKHKKETMSRLMADSKHLSEALRSALKNSMIKNDKDSLSTITDDIGTVVEKVYVTDPDGKVQYSSDKTIMYTSISPESIKNISENNAQEVKLNSSGHSQILENIIPVYNEKNCSNNSDCHSPDTKINGYLGVHISADEAISQLKERQKETMSGFLIILFLIIIAIVLLCRFLISKPLNYLRAIAQDIAKGNLAQNDAVIKSKDEIGQLAEAFNKMINELKKLVVKAELISNGIIGADEADEKMKAGMNLISATAVSPDGSGDLADTFARMQTELRKLTIQARRIAEDELHNTALNVRISGELGEAFSKMTSNLTEMSLFAERIAGGDFTVNAVLDTKDKVLTKAFVKMANNLRDLVLKINKEVEQVNSIATSFAVVAEQSSKNSTQLSQAIEQIARAASEVAQSTQSASSSSLKAQELSRQGRVVLNDMSGKVDAIKTSMIKSVENIKKLSNRSSEISEMISVITDIADQTNLLSLNAAIEAARAGEAGRGFAVVASEIRKLADSSQKQAQRISRIIQDILADTKQTQETTEKEAQHVEEGMSMINSVNKMFLEIVEQVDNIAAKMEQIAANAEETSASTEEVSAQAEEQNASMSEVAASATQLKASADSLQKSVSVFKT